MIEKRIAMWSGPRNISTAMMRAWENRPDTVVYDEPLYAHFLLASAHTDHPGYEETIRHHETDWQAVVEQLLGPIPEGKSIYYQKHMTHHLLPEVDLAWVNRLTNCFLIRDPLEVLLSLVEFLPHPTVEETGLPHQVRLFDQVAAHTGSVPPVIDAGDVLANPRGMLQALCDRLGVPFVNQMLRWPAGPRSTDGVWAPYWYSKVYETTEFGRQRDSAGSLPSHLLPILDEIRPLYDRLYQCRLQPASNGVAATT